MEGRQTGVTFTGGALASFGYFAIFLFLFVLVIPGAWGAVPFAVWWAANLSFDDGTRAEFTGRAGQIWVLFAVLALLAYLPAVATVAMGKGERANRMELVLTLALFPLDAAVKLALYRWFFANLRLLPGGTPRFTAGYPGYLGWSLLLGLSILTIIGWAWAAVAMVRWMCRHIESDHYAVSFHGTGWGLLWRSVLWLLGTVCIIPLPWVMRSTIAWWTNNLVLTHAADPAVEDDFPAYGTA